MSQSGKATWREAHPKYPAGQENRGSKTIVAPLTSDVTGRTYNSTPSLLDPADMRSCLPRRARERQVGLREKTMAVWGRCGDGACILTNQSARSPLAGRYTARRCRCWWTGQAVRPQPRLVGRRRSGETRQR